MYRFLADHGTISYCTTNNVCFSGRRILYLRSHRIHGEQFDSNVEYRNEKRDYFNPFVHLSVGMRDNTNAPTLPNFVGTTTQC